MNNEELLIAISGMFDSKLQAVNDRLDNMVTRQYFNDQLNNRLIETENTVLEEIDRVQIKSNNHYNDLSGQLKLINSTINAIKIENSTVNILLHTVSELQNEIEALKGLQGEVETLKQRLDKVS